MAVVIKNASILRSILLIGVFCFIHVAVNGQQSNSRPNEAPTCKVTTDQLPAILGLKLGMNPTEASEVLGRQVNTRPVSSTVATIAKDKSGSIIVEKSTKESIGENGYSYYPRDDTNLGSIVLRFWNDQIYKIVLTFDKRDFHWDDMKNNTIAIADRLGLPHNGWTEMHLTCDGFHIDASKSGQGIQIEVVDSKTDSSIQSQAEERIAFEAKQLGPPPKSTEPPAKPVLKRRPFQE